jgi:Zinc finger, C3HC4 type (RING finger)
MEISFTTTRPPIYSMVCTALSEMFDDNPYDFFSDESFMKELPKDVNKYFTRVSVLTRTSLPADNCSNGSESTCNICYEVPIYPFVTKCNHIFCTQCIQKYLSDTTSQHDCPTCRHSKILFSGLNLKSKKMKEWIQNIVKCDKCNTMFPIQMFHFHMAKCYQVNRGKKQS